DQAAKRKDDAAAFADYEAALGIDPSFEKALDRRAELHERREDWEAALRDYDRWVGLGRLEPNHHRRRRGLERPGGPRRVVEDCVARLTRSPDHVGTMHTLALLRAASHDDELHNGPEALALARRALELSRRRDQTSAALAALAAAHAECEEFDEAARR